MSQLRMIWKPENPRTIKGVPEGFSVRSMSFADIDGWCEVSRALTGENRWSNEEFIRNMLFNPPLTLLPRDIYCLFDDAAGAMVSTAAACLDTEKRLGNLHMVSAVPEYRGRGIGRAVCEAAVECFVRHGIAEATLSTDEFRVPAIKIYLGLGFRPWLYEEDMPGRWRGVFNDMGMTAPQPAYTAGKEDTTV